MHKRERITEEAELELRKFWISLTEKHGLTYAELTEMFSEQITHFATMQKRFERHGRYDKKACCA